MGKYAIAVDLGGTHLRAALMDGEGQILHHTRHKTMAHLGRDGVIDRIAEAVGEMQQKAEGAALLGVGLAAPGPVDPVRGILANPPNLPGWGEEPLASLLSEKVKMPVYLGNDANLAALGEHHYGAGRGYAHMIYLTVSTGVGGGIIIDNQLLVGSRGMAAEVGHIFLMTNQAVRLEPLASGTGIAQSAVEAIKTRPDSALAQLGQAPTTVDVVNAAKIGDPLALELLDQAAYYMGLCVASLVHLFDPQRFVVGGGVGNAWPPLLEQMLQKAREIVLPPYRHSFDLVPASLGDNTGLMGAGALVFDQK